ncbi:hypothetical protein [Caballeronia sp. GAWG2-1]|uniref:hypothetical protein n=1 Tax=Caballeronia sp. GAWG2-1 TaxID=2921744 RepID=UPI002028C155|nr:hypothetical protein [Caballeronia sp. GAWG2-1]
MLLRPLIVEKVTFGKIFRKNFFRLMYENDRVTTREAELFPQNLNSDVIRRFFTEGCRQAKTRAGICNATILAGFCHPFSSRRSGRRDAAIACTACLGGAFCSLVLPYLGFSAHLSCSTATILKQVFNGLKNIAIKKAPLADKGAQTLKPVFEKH